MTRRWTAIALVATLAFGSGATCRKNKEKDDDQADQKQAASKESESSDERTGRASTEESADDDEKTPDEKTEEEGELDAEDREAARSVADGNVRFGLELYGHLRDSEPDANLFYSPYNLAEVLAMVYAGAKDETAEEMAGALHFPERGATLHKSARSLRRWLRPETVDGEAPNEVETGNAVWSQEGLSVKEDFRDQLDRFYGAGLQRTNFRKAPESARTTINDWVDDQTRGMVTDLLPKGSIDARTRLVLTSAIYFKGAWASEFDPENTDEAEFTTLAGETAEVDMMSQRVEQGFRYTEGANHRAVELPYAGGRYRMVVVLPDEGAFGDVEQNLDAEFLSNLFDDLRAAPVDLKLPKFEMSARFSARQKLASLGMERAFTKEADFTGITEDEKVFVDDVLHKARVSVDEKGTEAAAASGATMRTTSLEPSEPDYREVVVDRPFLSFIRHEPSGSVLFVGRIAQLGSE